MTDKENESSSAPISSQNDRWRTYKIGTSNGRVIQCFMIMITTSISYIRSYELHIGISLTLMTRCRYYVSKRVMGTISMHSNWSFLKIGFIKVSQHCSAVHLLGTGSQTIGSSGPPNITNSIDHRINSYCRHVIYAHNRQMFESTSTSN